MGILTNKVKRSDIKDGDHIYSWRAIYTYTHHGIYVGGNKVVNFSDCEKGSSSSFQYSSRTSVCITSSSIQNSSCPKFLSIWLTSEECGFHQPGSGVFVTCLDCFCGKGSLRRYEYGVSTIAFLAKFRGGTCTTAKCDPAETVITRAMHLLLTGFGSYNVLNNNCEDFALYCKTGLVKKEKHNVGISGQTSSFWIAPVSTIVSAPLSLVIGPAGVATAAAGLYCKFRYDRDLGVREDVVKVEVENLADCYGDGSMAL